MKIKIYSIYDQAAKAYTAPFFLQNDGLAIRAFQDNVNATEENNISKHPDQFTLFHIGEWDDNEAKITPAETIKSLGNGLEYKNSTEDTDTVLTELAIIRKLIEDK